MECLNIYHAQHSMLCGKKRVRELRQKTHSAIPNYLYIESMTKVGLQFIFQVNKIHTRLKVDILERGNSIIFIDTMASFLPSHIINFDQII